MIKTAKVSILTPLFLEIFGLKIKNLRCFDRKNSRNSIMTKLFFSEPFLEAVPQVFVLICISFLSGIPSSEDKDVFVNCLEINCGLALLSFDKVPFIYYVSKYICKVFEPSIFLALKIIKK